MSSAEPAQVTSDPPPLAPAPLPRFDMPVPANGYRWWYLDALSDDGREGLTLIAFIGSVFSPYYVRSRQHGHADPRDHCAMNVALYGSRRRWALTERDRAALSMSAGQLAIGPSALRWAGDELVATLDERTAPFPLPFRRPVRGEVRIRPDSLTSAEFQLDTAGRHVWRPLAPAARVEVRLEEPALRWSGRGYLDSNAGSEPLEAAFRGWNWSRTHGPGETLIYYDVDQRDGHRTEVALRVTAAGEVLPLPTPPRARLLPTLWGIRRETRAHDRQARVLRTLEDTPFYARSVLALGPPDREVRAVHEALHLGRFKTPWVQFLIPYRMPRQP